MANPISTLLSIIKSQNSIKLLSKKTLPLITSSTINNNITNNNKLSLNNHQIKNYSTLNNNNITSSTNNQAQYSITNNNINPLYFPYGESDFFSIRTSQQFYIDKTNLIPLIEQCGKHLLFVRPPRWGKSLLLSMLSSYYDINKKDKFDQVFDGLWIGHPENQTLLRSQYHVLHLDFSIDVSGSIEDTKKAFYAAINSDIKKFLTLYNMEHEIQQVISLDDALASFDHLVTIMLKHKNKFMVLIDEYDRFANKLMFEIPELTGKHADATSSLIRSFFERLKKASASGLIDFRSLIVGINPITLSSDYNVKDISHFEPIGNLVGFTEADLRMALQNIGILNEHQNNAISLMKQFYNGYHFPGSTQPLFNPTLSLYFLDKMLRENHFKRKIIEGQSISLISMIDKNTKISENVFSNVTSVFPNIVQQLTATNRISFNNSMVTSFKLGEINLNSENFKQIWDKLLSFMYYHGMLTLSKEECNTLMIPNEIVKVQYLEQLKIIISLNENVIEKFINYPTADNLKNLLWNIIKQQEIIYDNSMAEGGLLGSIESALRAQKLCNLFTKKEMFKNGKYNLIISTTNDVFIIEFKRIKPNLLEDFSRLTWFTNTYKEIFSKLIKFNDQQLLQMKVKCGTFNEITTVENILHNTINSHQVKEYECDELNMEMNKGKNIHSYVVVQVGWPIIVRKVRFPLQYFK